MRCSTGLPVVGIDCGAVLAIEPLELPIFVGIAVYCLLGSEARKDIVRFGQLIRTIMASVKATTVEITGSQKVHHELQEIQSHDLPVGSQSKSTLSSQ